MIYTLDFDSFPIVYGKITIPKGTIFYRGYNPLYPISNDRPTYFTSNYKVAEAYSKLSKNGKIGVFITKKEITIYDIRYMKNIINNIFDSKVINTEKSIEVCSNLALSYGICTFKNQIKLFKARYKDELKSKKINTTKKTLEYIKNVYTDMKSTGFYSILESQGFRYGETENDLKSNFAIKKLFDGKIDGYIAPSLNSPFHINQNYIIQAELLLFNPLDSIHEIKMEALNNINNKLLKPIKIENLLDKKQLQTFDLDGFEETSVYFKGGLYKNNMNKIRVSYDPNKLSDSMSNSEYRKIELIINKGVDELLGKKSVSAVLMGGGKKIKLSNSYLKSYNPNKLIDMLTEEEYKKIENSINQGIVELLNGSNK